MIKIGKRAFVLAALILLTLMIVSGILTRTVAAGRYERIEVDGRMQVVSGTFAYTPKQDYPVWRWFTAPIEVLYAPGAITVITIILFLVIVAGSFTVLERGDILSGFLRRIAERMHDRRFLLMAALQAFFLLSAAILGIFEAMVPLIVFVVPLAHILKWDSLTGLGMSLLPLAFGFSAAVTNPFTIGVAQTIAELPLFSGAWLRIILMVIVFVLVHLAVRRHALRVERRPESSPVWEEDHAVRAAIESESDSNRFSVEQRRALIWFGANMGLAILFIITTAQMPSISTYAFPLMAVLFLTGGIGAGRLSGMSWKTIAATFGSGTLNMLPGVLLIMMSMSVKHIVDSGGITDTILHSIATSIADRPPVIAGFLIYLATLAMNFFIGSASAKAFLMMPILTPLADLVGLTRQTAVLAFGFGDGFSNMIYPTNALLLIGLSFTSVSWVRWVRWTLPLQAIIFVITCVFLAFAVRIGYGPF